MTCLLDLTAQRWAALWSERGREGGEHELLVARYGGLVERRPEEGGSARWSPAPFLRACAVAAEGERVWVATELGELWERRDRVWRSEPLPDLRARLPHGVELMLTSEGKLYLTHRAVLFELAGSRLEACGQAPPGPGTVSRAEDGSLVILANARAYSFRAGRFSPLSLPPSAQARGTLRAARAARGGGAWIVDDAGSLFHLFPDGRCRVLHRGHITRWQRHTYPDPEPDDYDNAVTSAAIGWDGTVVLLRPSVYGDGLTEEKIRPGAVQERARGAFDPRTPRELRIQLEATDFEPPPLPELKIAGLEGAEIRISGGGPTLELERGEPAEARLAPQPGPLLYRGERWSLHASELRIEASSESHRLVLEAPGLALLPQDGAPPWVLDRRGRLYLLDGSGLRRERHELKLEEVRHVARLRGGVRVADDHRVHELPLPTPAGLPKAATVEQVESALRSAVAPLHLFTLPIAREAAERSLARFMPMGPTRAAMTLTKLFEGEEEAPGPESPERLALALMAGLGPEASYRRLASGERTLAWVALLDNEAVVCADRRSARAVSEALRAGEREG